MNDEIKPRTTRVEVRNPSPPSESISDGLAVAAISEITKIINDHQYIMSIKLEIEHVDQPVEDYPTVFTAEIPNNPDNNLELLIQKAEMQFREMADGEGLSAADELDTLVNITMQRIRDIICSGIKPSADALNQFIAKAINGSYNVIMMTETIEQFQRWINKMDI